MASHGLRPQFAQLYIYDTEHEVQNSGSLAVVCMWCQERVENANIPFGGKPIVYPDLLERYMDPTYLATRAICIIDSDLYITNIRSCHTTSVRYMHLYTGLILLIQHDIQFSMQFLRHTCPGLSSVMPTVQGIQPE
ncbi:hypothetical protein ACJX0J_025214, partial [Zea mays]